MYPPFPRLAFLIIAPNARATTETIRGARQQRTYGMTQVCTARYCERIGVRLSRKNGGKFHSYVEEALAKHSTRTVSDSSRRCGTVPPPYVFLRRERHLFSNAAMRHKSRDHSRPPHKHTWRRKGQKNDGMLYLPIRDIENEEKKERTLGVHKNRITIVNKTDPVKKKAKAVLLRH